MLALDWCAHFQWEFPMVPTEERNHAIITEELLLLLLLLLLVLLLPLGEQRCWAALQRADGR